MTPKEKAKELIDKFTEKSFTYEYSIECALICVDEIFRQPKFFIMKQEIKDYWKEVKQELLKL